MMHEGASGGGKSELLQEVPRVADGRVLLGVNIETNEKTYISMSDTCTILPVTDDMAMCQPGYQPRNGKLALTDGEDGWFIRVDGITEMCAPQAILRKYPKKIFASAIEVPFENERLPIPVGYDTYLRMAFGDYMKLPPKEQQKGHHDAAFLDLDHPYEQYKGIHYCCKK